MIHPVHDVGIACRSGPIVILADLRCLLTETANKGGVPGKYSLWLINLLTFVTILYVIPMNCNCVKVTHKVS